MSLLAYKTLGMSNPRGLSRVYFSCHRDDFEKYFEELSDEIIKKQNCAVWYPEDMDAERDEEYLDRLSEMQLFVIPVTAKLLFENNPVVTTELSFAKEKHIPVLPIMMETGLEKFFNEKFGELQFLDKFSIDTTAISYDEKLTKYLESVLVGDELAKRIREEFDAYIFLSYRKKDRRHAQDLMRKIHERDFCRDIAIWYDEYLTPGENFNDSIKEAFDKSELFVLAVTPNLVNEENYVMTVEYPMAKKAGKPILPAELVETDKNLLSAKYEEIPKCANAHNPTELSSALKTSVDKIVKKGNDSSPEHNFLIGMAYLNGIDVEVDKKRAFELISSSAEAGYVDAMKKLRDMYHEGLGVELDWNTALEWSVKVVEYYTEKHGEESFDTLACLGDLASDYTDLGMFEKAYDINEKLYLTYKRFFGKDSQSTLRALVALALNGKYVLSAKDSLEISKNAYERCKNALGNESHITYVAFKNLASAYLNCGKYRKALDLSFEAYVACLITFDGEDNLITAEAYLLVAQCFTALKKRKDAQSIYESVYETRRRILGEDHPHTIDALTNVAVGLFNRGRWSAKKRKRAVELFEKSYEMHCKAFGEDNAITQNVKELLKKVKRDMMFDRILNIGMIVSGIVLAGAIIYELII